MHYVFLIQICALLKELFNSLIFYPALVQRTYIRASAATEADPQRLI